MLKICECLAVSNLILAECTSVWDRIKSPGADQVVPYASLPDADDSKHLDKLAVLKVNGGLGTSMGSSVCTSL